MKTIALVLAWTLALMFPWPGHSQAADTYTLSTYYPAPNGKYDNLSAVTFNTTTFSAQDITANNTFACANTSTFGGNVTINADLSTQQLTASDIATFGGAATFNAAATFRKLTTIHTNDGTEPILGLIKSGGSSFYLTPDSPGGKLDIRTSAAVASQIFTVTTTGNVGIGATGSSWTPTSKLAVQGDTTLTGNTAISGSATFGVDPNPKVKIDSNSISLSNSSLMSPPRIALVGVAKSHFIGVNNAGALVFSPLVDLSAPNFTFSDTGDLGVKNNLTVNGIANITGDTTFTGKITANGKLSVNNVIELNNTIELSQALGGPANDKIVLAVNYPMNAPLYYWSSDERLKENIHPLTDALAKVKALNGVSYNFKKNPEKQIGLIAQNVERTVPEVVRTGQDGMKSVEYGSLIGLLIEAIKEQQSEIEKLQETVHAQGKQLEAIKPSP